MSSDQIPGTLIPLLLFFGMPTLIYLFAEMMMRIHDLEQAVNSSPDAKHFMAELAKKRSHAKMQLADATRPGPRERCEECGWYKGLLIADDNSTERRCINSACSKSGDLFKNDGTS